tara:strand:+ start:4258 stop:5184 length:927 start_codon:yes stop_codon:yes gene_type:complete
MSNLDIKIKQVTYKEKNELHILFFGKDMNYVLMNTLRRLVIQHIPIYSFKRENIKITKNTSVFNNDTFSLRLSNIPIQNIKVEDLNDKYLDLFNKFEINQEDFNNITLNLNKKNDGNNILNVTTDHCEFYDKNGKIGNIYKKPVLLIKLKKNQEIKVSMVSELNIGLHHIIYSPVSICCYEEKNDNEFLLKLESKGQMNEYQLLKKACDIFKIKCLNLKIQIKDMKDINDNKGELVFKNENHTIGNILSRYLQDHKNIVYTGYKMDHLMIEEVQIKYETDGTKNIKDILDEIIDICIMHFEHINKLLK